MAGARYGRSSLMLRTRSRRIRSAVKYVLRRIRPKERQILETIVEEIYVERRWQETTIGLLEHAGQTYPTVNSDGTESGAGIVFQLPIYRLFSDLALRGVVAH